MPDWLSGNAWMLPVAVGAVMLPFVVVEPLWRYAVHRWELSGDVVYARSGWLSREWVFVPVSRIQTVDKAQLVRACAGPGHRGDPYGIARRVIDDQGSRLRGRRTAGRGTRPPRQELRDDAT